MVVDTPIAHLDQEFDYLVPAGMEGVAAGVRVMVPLAGRQTPAWVTQVRGTTDFAGRLSSLQRLISPVPVLTPEVLQLCRDVAAATAGTVPDVIRLAVPARHARVEQAADLTPVPLAPAPDAGEDVGDGAEQLPGWEHYTGGPALLRHLRAGSNPRAVWTALPGVVQGPEAVQGQGRWELELRAPVAATLASGRRVLVVVPTTRDAERLGELLRPLGPVVVTHGELKPPDRYRAFLSALTGRASIVVGTRSAAFAPVPQLGLVAIWDPDDENLTERRAPYPSALTVVAHRRDCAVLIGAHNRPVRAQQAIQDGWAVAIAAPRAVVRQHAPRVSVPDEGELRGETARLPSLAFRTVRAALTEGPVLVHVPLAGYLRAVRCATCRAAVRCRHCGGALRLGPAVSCGWCGRPQAVSCPECGSTRLAAFSVGSERTSEEVARAFPGVPVVLSNGRVGVTSRVDSRPSLVIATPGAEPIPSDGYAAGLILDAALATARPELDAAALALQRWLHALALLRPQAPALVLGGAESAVAGALVRWDPAGHAVRELEERAGLHFPPAWRLARITGEQADLAAVAAALTSTRLAGLQTLGPVEGALIVRVPRELGRALMAALRTIQRERSARKDGVVHVHIDPATI